MSEPKAPRESLAEMLWIEGRGAGCYAARLEDFWGSTLSGDLVGRAVRAASAELGDVPSAVQSHLLDEPHPDAELLLAVENEGRDRVRVAVTQAGRPLAQVHVRAPAAAAGISYQSATLEPGLPAAEDLPSEAEVAESEGWAQYAVGPIEARRIGAQTSVKDNEPAVWLGWLRPRVALPTDPQVEAAALAFLAEYRSHWAIERRLGAAFRTTRITLLDHMLWVHRFEPWNDWRLVKTVSDVGADGRCFSRREIYSRDGALLASAAWEAEARPA